MEWINVEDRLPKISHDEILLWNGRFEREGRYLAAAMGGRGYFYDLHDKVLLGITHWMPLPKPPQD